MGWLFALALGLQQRSARAIWIALVPIALGHAASLLLVAVAVAALGRLVSTQALATACAAILLVFGVYKLRAWYRHPRWVGMRVGVADLLGWSFLMATAHGAGLMIAPALVAIAAGGGAPGDVPMLALGVLLHTAAMLLVMAAVAWLVYRKLGLAVLRRGWVNFDLIWAAALIVVGLIALAAAIAHPDLAAQVRGPSGGPVQPPMPESHRARSGASRPPVLTETQVSAGGVAYRISGGRTEVALVAVGPARRWQLPKGQLRAGETPEAAAIRETAEEAGVLTELVAPLERIEYWYYGDLRGRRVRFHKFVHFFLLRFLEGDVSEHDAEVEDARWVPIAEAASMLAFASERKVLEQAAELLKTATSGGP